jgi:hypothetical protein
MAAILTGKEVISLSTNRPDGECQYAITEETLNHMMSAPGFPDHELKIKVGVATVLLRNLNLKSRLCNGTRLVIED